MVTNAFSSPKGTTNDFIDQANGLAAYQTGSQGYLTRHFNVIHPSEFAYHTASPGVFRGPEEIAQAIFNFVFGNEKTLLSMEPEAIKVLANQANCVSKRYQLTFGEKHPILRLSTFFYFNSIMNELQNSPSQRELAQWVPLLEAVKKGEARLTAADYRGFLHDRSLAKRDSGIAESPPESPPPEAKKVPPPVKPKPVMLEYYDYDSFCFFLDDFDQRIADLVYTFHGSDEMFSVKKSESEDFEDSLVDMGKTLSKMIELNPNATDEELLRMLDMSLQAEAYMVELNDEFGELSVEDASKWDNVFFNALYRPEAFDTSVQQQMRDAVTLPGRLRDALANRMTGTVSA